MSGRALTRDEVALARSVFGGAIAYDRVRIAAQKWAFFQPRGVVMAPRGAIHFHPKGALYCDDFCAAPLARQGLFIHEMVHVWQHQQGMNLLLRRHPFCHYGYVMAPGKPFHAYGIEQQAEIVRHWFLLKSGVSVPGAPGLEVYAGLVPFAGE